MPIDFTLSPEIEALRLRVRQFIDDVVKPGESKIEGEDKVERAEYLKILLSMRERRIPPVQRLNSQSLREANQNLTWAPARRGKPARNLQRFDPLHRRARCSEQHSDYLRPQTPGTART